MSDERKPSISERRLAHGFAPLSYDERHENLQANLDDDHAAEINTYVTEILALKARLAEVERELTDQRVLTFESERQRDEALDLLAKMTNERDAYKAVAVAAAKWWAGVVEDGTRQRRAAMIDAIDTARAAGLFTDEELAK